MAGWVWAAVPVRRPAASAVAGATELAGAANEWKFFLIIFFKSAVITVLRDRDGPLEILRRPQSDYRHGTARHAIAWWREITYWESTTYRRWRLYAGDRRTHRAGQWLAEQMCWPAERGIWTRDACVVRIASTSTWDDTCTQHHRHAHRPSPTCNAFTRHFRMEEILKRWYCYIWPSETEQYDSLKSSHVTYP